MYSVKEIYYTLQGEGFYTGRPSVFLRFTGCNLWSGKEKDRKKAICDWCDTDFIGNDGINGGKYLGSEIIKIIKTLWPKKEQSKPYIVFTGGEPLIQLDNELIERVHKAGFEIGVETNGTMTPPSGIDWICVSPKARSNFILKKGNELKVVFPQYEFNPLDHENLEFEHFFIQPMDGLNQKENIRKSEDFVLKYPRWKLSIQTHKILGIP
ncbi:MAG: 7-carboxy-7-deazaguanine synthase [Fidelibacterota bacterium]|jgi:7-carboxy-7-deazaguanine synthase|tara:strand:+ start:228 stop:857 length:630 start_codon:yes stop_codon:yes gene_type:complete